MTKAKRGLAGSEKKRGKANRGAVSFCIAPPSTRPYTPDIVWRALIFGQRQGSGKPSRGRDRCRLETGRLARTLGLGV